MHRERVKAPAWRGCGQARPDTAGDGQANRAGGIGLNRQDGGRRHILQNELGQGGRAQGRRRCHIQNAGRQRHIGYHGRGVAEGLARFDKASRRAHGGQHLDWRRISDERVIDHALDVHPNSRIIVRTQLFFSQVVDTIAIAVGNGRVAGDTNGHGGCPGDGQIPTAEPRTGGLTICWVDDGVPHFVAIGNQVAIAVALGGVAAQLYLLGIAQTIAVAVTEYGRDRLPQLAPLQLDQIGQPVIVAVGRSVVGVNAAAAASQQAIAIGIFDGGEAGIPGQPSTAICRRAHCHKAVQGGGEDVVDQRAKRARVVAFGFPRTTDRKDRREEGQNDIGNGITFVGRHAIAHIEHQGDALVQASRGCKGLRQGVLPGRLAAIHRSEQKLVVFAHSPAAVHLVPARLDGLGNRRHAQLHGAAAQIVRRVEPEVGIDIQPIGRVRVFMFDGAGDGHAHGQVVASDQPFGGILECYFWRAGHDQIGAAHIDHQIIVVEEIGHIFGGRAGEGKTTAASAG